jgi:hypothetical protein
VAAAAGLAACGFVGDSFDQPARTRAVAVADLDGDGDLDAFLANAKNDIPPRDTVWLNDGAGTFSQRAQRLEQGVSLTVAAGDLDGDGDADILVIRNRRAEVLLNDGTGLFSAGPSTGWGLEHAASAAALGDLDGDGDLDAFVSGCCGVSGSADRRYLAYTTVWLNDGAGRFIDSGQALGDLGSWAAALGDLDGDGDLDAFVANSASDRGGAGAPRQNEPNTVWLNDGAGRFTDSGQRLGAADTVAAALGDLDGDGDLDAFVGNARAADEVWLNDGLGNFSDSGQSLGNADTQRVALGDVDRDGDLDAVADTNGGTWVWVNDGLGAFGGAGQHLSHDPDCAATLGDVDGDGDLDLLAGCVDREVTIWLNDGAGDWTRQD